MTETKDNTRIRKKLQILNGNGKYKLHITSMYRGFSSKIPQGLRKIIPNLNFRTWGHTALASYFNYNLHDSHPLNMTKQLRINRIKYLLVALNRDF